MRTRIEQKPARRGLRAVIWAATLAALLPGLTGCVTGRVNDLIDREEFSFDRVEYACVDGQDHVVALVRVRSSGGGSRDYHLVMNLERLRKLATSHQGEPFVVFRHHAPARYSAPELVVTASSAIAAGEGWPYVPGRPPPGWREVVRLDPYPYRVADIGKPLKLPDGKTSELTWLEVEEYLELIYATPDPQSGEVVLIRARYPNTVAEAERPWLYPLVPVAWAADAAMTPLYVAGLVYVCTDIAINGLQLNF